MPKSNGGFTEEQAAHGVRRVRTVLIHGTASDCRSSGINDEHPLTIGRSNEALVSKLAREPRGELAIVERIIEAVPGCLGVRDMHRPAHLGLISRDLADHCIVLIEGVHAKALHLLLYGLLAVLEASIG